MRIDVSRARAVEGVVCVATADDLKDVCKALVGVLSHFAGLRSEPQGRWPTASATGRANLSSRSSQPAALSPRMRSVR